jgi:uncharacterized protein
MSRVLAGAVASPCVSVCVMDARIGLCAGCHRTLDEIAAWSVLDDDARRAIVAALPGRKLALAAPEILDREG